MSNIGERIRFLRKKNFMNQEELARLLREKYNLKTERAMISKWETGFQSPGIETLVAISKIFSVSLDYLACQEVFSNEQSDRFIPLYADGLTDISSLCTLPQGSDADFCFVIKSENKLLGIEYGDNVFAKKDFNLTNGTKVVAQIDGEFHVKTWFLYDKNGLLAGDGEKPVILNDSDEVKILGKAVMVQRSI